ncbi:glutamate 5-kinase [Bradyrhizobium sp. CCBAU 51753]|uniref:glutamate 5-kinase n=1 Tax=Bradyrhizobium sp. CCBAU 51753 TaxID=1325100 RepID=UPI00188D3413|nr:glutamate 5-kinase [Bradyrhizobium sp. CCBAU 51753]QOZ23926.1 glutamate 5-kinase [Bradyrhizobium sp. CCBAU 51753]
MYPTELPPLLASARRIVVKVGSALIVDSASGKIRESWLEMLAEDVARLRGRGQDVAVVSSGAVAIGRYALDLHQKTLSRADRQAAAAVGQMHLARMYKETFGRSRLTTAQLLLTLDDTTERQRLLSVRATLIKLLSLRAVPVVNENDAITGSTASFGDNDRLAARAARLIGSDALVLLSNVAGLYSADPNTSSTAILIKEIHDLTPEIERMATGARSGYSSGGMVTKLVAARMALASGCTVIIADGRDAHPLSAIDAGKACTWFHPSTAARIARKTWIAGTLKPAGVLVINNSAVTQLRLGRSLYVVGVISSHGDFARGDAVVIRDVHGLEVARGLSIYSSTELRCITWRFGIEARPPFSCRKLEQIVHKDDLTLSE